MKSNALYLLVLIASCAFAQQVNAQCSSLYYPQSGRVWVNHDLGGLPNYTKYVRFKIDTPIPNPNVTLFIFQSPNGFLSYDPVNNRMGYGVTHNRQGCNCCGNGCSSTEGYTFASGLTLNEWHTVAIAVDSNDDVTIMLDGVIQSPVGPSFDGCCSGNYNYTVIGNLIGGNNPRGFYGWIDEAALWNTELSAADLIALNECDAAPLSSAYGYWDFNEGTGAVAVDQSGNGFDGNVQSLTYTDDTGDCCAAGCTDENAANYDPSALEDDGSCIFPGCTDQSADNYDPNANEDDGSCLFNGCTNPVACNYDANANSDDGSCILPGCTDDAACNYDPQAGCDDGSCAYTIDCAGICGGSFVNDECGNCYDPALANETVEVIFDYTGSAQSWIVPDGVTYITLDLYGGQGSNQTYGGWGGRASGSLNVTPGQELFLYVAGSGWQGGWNGGGNTLDGNGRRGGGASDVRLGGNDLTDRIIVAGGGGCLGNSTVGGCNGAETPLYGGAGGGEVGGTGESGNNGVTGGSGGTQNSGGIPGTGTIGTGSPGTLGQGGNGYSTDRGGGGGGYFGGAGGGSSSGCNRGAGGGGSNYLGGVTPILSESGVNEGSGQIIISYEVVLVPECLPGCTDPSADNYNEAATDDDGSCIFAGCTQSGAENYDPNANLDDGSCIFPGCTDDSADNYDPNANEDDGSCLFNGCTNPVACNYDANANSDDGSCILPGCTDDAACNYDPQAGCDEGSCAYTIDCAGICGGSFVNDECGNCYDPALANETIEVIFDYTGSAQSWIVPDGVTQVTFDVYGAQGSDQAHGGWGGRASGSLNVNSGDEYLIYVGGSGWTGGWNGGGNLASGNERRGGGASDIRHGGASLTDRIIVAGGGGVRGNATTSGCNSTDIPITGGAGGAETGETGGNGGTATGGTGGTQNAGGSPGSGNIGSGTPGTLGAGGNGFSNDAFGGGGGGYYGGGGGGTSGGCNRGAGGGGSNYIGGVTPILSESGVNEGSGQIIISYNIANVPDCVLGCTDDNADNYNAEATNDDGSCIYLGCTNEQADNYDPNANQDDGSCIFSGCTDQSADNYDPNANQDDGSCIFSGCTNQQADNYDPVANQDDGSCIFSGCTDSGADNYDPNANLDDGSCIFSGCTDENADNYDPQANNEDGSCIYLGCTDLEAANYDASANQDDGSCIYPGCTNDAAVNYDPQANQDDGSCIIEGCTYENAVNYNAEANKDDGTCIFPDCPAPSGCTDQLACNYSPIAITDDGSCTYDCFGCTYATADNYDPAATVDDASCIFTAGSEFCADGTTWDSETETCIPLPDTCPEDFNDDGLVNSSDLLFFLGRFGGSCE